jgi:protein O-mannosyl-transferase
MKKKYTYLIVIFLIITSCVAFSRIAGNDFINLDDAIYIFENHHIQSGISSESIKWAFKAFVDGNWHPLTFISHMLDWSLFGATASGHHLISLLLHIGAVIFLFLFLNKTTKNIWPSAFAAFFFALHPLRVESVAWATERKDVLSMFFGMATIYAYAFYAENSKIFQYLLSLILFALALMSKSMMVTLPFALMLLDYWPLGRWQRAMAEKGRNRFKMAGKLIWEKVPFICLTIAVSIIAFWTQNKDGLVIPLDILPFLTRVANAVVSYVAYLGKTLWPVNLAVFYPYDVSLLLWKALISGIILIVITMAVLYYIKKLPFLFVGWFWFLGTLVPVIGLVQLCTLAMADRYTYLPSIGIAMMLSWGIPLLFKCEDNRKKILFPAGIAILTILAVLTWKQCAYWKNSIELWNHTLQVTKNNYLAHNCLGLALFAEGKTEEAIDHYNKTISIDPNYTKVYFDRGGAYAKLGQYQSAIKDYNKVIRLKPSDAIAYSNRGKAYDELGQYKRAIEDFNKAITLKPDYSDAYNNRGFAYGILGQIQRAFEDFNKAILLKPNAEAYYNRGVAYVKLGRFQQALDDFNKAILLKPDYADAYNNRKFVSAKLIKQQRTVEIFNEDTHLKTGYAVSYNSRGVAYVKLGKYQLAIEAFNKAISLKENYADAYNNRGAVYLEQGDNTLGCSDAQKACELGNCEILKVAKGKGDCR